MALYEKRVDFKPRHVQIFDGEQFNDWFLAINPRGEVPVLQDGDNIIVESTKIVEYIDSKYGHPYLLLPKDNPKVKEYITLFDSIPLFALTYGVFAFHAEQTTDMLRYPYCQEALRINSKHMMIHRPVLLREEAQKQRGKPAEAALRQKAKDLESIREVFLENDKIHGILYDLEVILDKVEAELDSDDRPGPWLCGTTFSAADVTLISILMRLYQLGLDQRYWKGGVRPNLAVYQELAFRRPSVLKATKWRDYEGKFLVIARNTNGSANDNGPESGMTRSESVDAAKVGLGAVLLLGGIYACKKLMNK